MGALKGQNKGKKNEMWFIGQRKTEQETYPKQLIRHESHQSRLRIPRWQRGNSATPTTPLDTTLD